MVESSALVQVVPPVPSLQAESTIQEKYFNSCAEPVDKPLQPSRSEVNSEPFGGARTTESEATGGMLSLAGLRELVLPTNYVERFGRRVTMANIRDKSRNSSDSAASSQLLDVVPMVTISDTVLYSAAARCPLSFVDISR